MTSSEYGKHVYRSRRMNAGDEESVSERKQQLELKCKVHKLRHKVRQMESIERKQCRVIMTSSQKADYEKYKSGALIEELDALTRQHGFGKLHGEGVLLHAPRVTEQLPQRCMPQVPLHAFAAAVNTLRHTSASALVVNSSSEFLAQC